MKEKKKKSKNKVLETIKMLSSSERGRAFLFFGFYIVFFFVVILLVRASHNAPVREPQIKKEVTYSYRLENLEKKNYHYKYLSTIGEDVFLYEGDRLENKELFQVTTAGNVDHYYRDGELFIKNENNTWIVSDTPYLLQDFYEVENIKKILEEAEFIAKTEYKNKNLELKFSISTKALIKCLMKERNPSTLEEGTNEIVLTLDGEKNVKRIEYDLTEFYQTVYQLPKKVFLELTYSNEGLIKEIERP